jgi:hypothetical protein
MQTNWQCNDCLLSIYSEQEDWSPTGGAVEKLHPKKEIAVSMMQAAMRMIYQKELKNNKLFLLQRLPELCLQVARHSLEKLFLCTTARL